MLRPRLTKANRAPDGLIEERISVHCHRQKGSARVAASHRQDLAEGSIAGDPWSKREVKYCVSYVLLGDGNDCGSLR